MQYKRNIIKFRNNSSPPSHAIKITHSVRYITIKGECVGNHSMHF